MKKRRSVENNNYQEMPKVKKSFEGKQLEVENHHKDKKESFKMSKKHILINKNMPVDYSNNQQGKVRVFEIH